MSNFHPAVLDPTPCPVCGQSIGVTLVEHFFPAKRGYGAELRQWIDLRHPDDTSPRGNYLVTGVSDRICLDVPGDAKADAYLLRTHVTQVMHRMLNRVHLDWATA